MQAHVLQQGVLGGQRLTAHGAGVWPLPRVHPGMNLQGVLLSKALSTLTAFEGSLPYNQSQEARCKQELCISLFSQIKVYTTESSV